MARPCQTTSLSPAGDMQVPPSFSSQSTYPDQSGSTSTWINTPFMQKGENEAPSLNLTGGLTRRTSFIQPPRYTSIRLIQFQIKIFIVLACTHWKRTQKEVPFSLIIKRHDFTVFRMIVVHFLHVLKSPSGCLSCESVSPKLKKKSYQVVSLPLTRGRSYSPVLS